MTFCKLTCCKKSRKVFNENVGVSELPKCGGSLSLLVVLYISRVYKCTGIINYILHRAALWTMRHAQLRRGHIRRPLQTVYRRITILHYAASRVGSLCDNKISGCTRDILLSRCWEYNTSAYDLSRSQNVDKSFNTQFNWNDCRLELWWLN